MSSSFSISLGAGLRRLFWLLTTLALAACSTAGAGPVGDSGIQLSGALGYGALTGQSVYWIDNDRVLFLGSRRDRISPLSEREDSLKTLLLEWNIQSAQLKTHAELGLYSGLCFDGGYIRYHFKDGADVVIRAGEFGHEVQIPNRITRTIRLNNLTCREYDATAVAESVGKGFRPLKEEHGYWGGRSSMGGNSFSTYLKKQANALSEHTVPIRNVGFPIRWSTFSQAYVFRRAESLFSASHTSGKLWLLFPAGAVKEIDIPPGPWFAGSTQYGITKVGVFISSKAIGNHGIGHAGGYVLDVHTGAIRQVIAGYIHSFDVSPDGCKVAASVRFSIAPGQIPDLVAIDVCRGRR